MRNRLEELLNEIEEREQDNLADCREAGGMNTPMSGMAMGALEIVREIREFLKDQGGVVMIKLYKFFGCDWYAAKNLRDAVRECRSNTGRTIREILEEYDVVSEDDMDQLKFIDDVCDPDNSSKRTFREQLELMIARGERFPCPFATSEW